MHGRSPQAVDAIEDLLATVVLSMAGAAAGVSLVVLAGAELAAVVFGGGAFDAGLSDSLEALVALPGTFGDPARAWPDSVRDRLPGPVPYWTCTIAMLLAVAAAAWFGMRWWTSRSRKGPFGSGKGGLARSRDTRTLAVGRPVAGRLTLGLHGRRLLAAEPRTSLAVVGPTGCGKTVGFAIPALLEWDGPVIATSVKTDLLDATLAHRSRVGTTWVYDPTSCSGLEASRWSPLSACADWVGAMRVATWLCEAAQPRSDSVTDGDYWYSQARKGLAPYLHAAATSGRTMADVVGWIDLQEETEVEAALVDAAGLDTQLVALERDGRAAALRDLYADEVRNELVADVRDRYSDAGSGRASRWVDQDVLYWPPEVQEQVTTEIEAELSRRVDSQLQVEARRLRLSGRFGFHGVVGVTVGSRSQLGLPA